MKVQNAQRPNQLEPKCLVPSVPNFGFVGFICIIYESLVLVVYVDCPYHQYEKYYKYKQKLTK